MRRTVEEAEVAVHVELAVVVRHAHRTTDDRTFVLLRGRHILSPRRREG
jgi:hypothetical protein